MATDAKFDRIQKIIPHTNSDNLEIAIVSNFPCVVKKGEFKENDWVFYIRDDAKLLGYDYEKNREKSDTPFIFPWPWQEQILKYLGTGGRVKTIKLRGQTSMGILIRIQDVLTDNHGVENLEKIVLDDMMYGENSNILNDHSYLEKKFGVGHWTAPETGFGDMNVLHQGLDFGVSKSDEENWENIDESDLHLGFTALVTKKLDGTSATVICQPNGEYSIASRSQTFNVKKMNELGTENIYTKFTKEAVDAGLWYAKTYNKVIAIRGEVCCSSVQKFGINKDKDLNGFFIYGVEFPEETNYYEMKGIYGSGHHFTDIVKLCNGNGFNLKTVPVLGEEILSKEMLSKYNEMPADWGEGVVVNVKCTDPTKLTNMIWDYKSKSREYLMKIK